MRPDQLFVEATKQFDFLASEYGFTIGEKVERAPESRLVFWSPTTVVTVTYAISGDLWVKISRRRDYQGRVLEGEGYDLTFLLEERAPEELQRITAARDAGDLELAIQLQAASLRRYGKDLLLGDFEVFPALRQRSEENLRRKEEEVYGRGLK